MKLEQIYTGCLAQGAYYISSENEAVIIDPLREVQPYLDRAAADGVKIKYVLETHFHADFVSGHLDLSAKSGAKIVFGPTARPNFDAHIAADGEILNVGKITIKVLHTPGHTMESVTYLLRDESGKDVAIFSGDTLFLGDVGRPDLAQKAASMTKEELAGLLYDSLRTKIMPLADEVIVYPAHGAGSACGKNMMKETVDTLGNQKKINYALRSNLTKEEFVKELTENLLPAPAYFPENVRMNKEGYESIDNVLSRGTRALTVNEFEVASQETNALIIDTREAQIFASGFIPNSINIGIDGSFAPWVGALVPGTDHPILLITEHGRETEVVTRLARVGYNNTIGFLQGGFESWLKSGKEIDKISSVDAETFSKIFVVGKTKVIDVRKPGEYEAEHVDGADNVPLDFLNDQIDEIPATGEVYVHCAGGYRSMIALSILRARGWKNLIDVKGGFKSIESTSIPRTDFVCSSKKVK